MQKKKKLQILFFVVLGLGFVLTLFSYTRFYGCILLCLLIPSLGLHYVLDIKKSESTMPVNLSFRYPLLIALQITFIVFLIKMFFMTMHWPFVGPLNALVYGVSIVALLIGIVFIILNRKIIQSVFIIEITLLILPVFLMLTFVIPANYNGSEYTESMQRQYANLTEIKYVLYQQAKKDTLNDLKQVDLIEQAKKYVITGNGGYNENGTIYRGMSKISDREIERYMPRINNDSIAYRIRRQHPGSVIEYINILTKLQIDLLLKEKK